MDRQRLLIQGIDDYKWSPEANGLDSGYSDGSSVVDNYIYIFWNYYTIVIFMSSRRQINTVSENVYFCLFAYSSLHSRTFCISLL